MSHDTSTPVRLRWARLRFAIISQLLQSPPASGELNAAIAELASRSWRHPTNGDSLRFSAKSIERWYYLAKDDPNPIEALERSAVRDESLRRGVVFRAVEVERHDLVVKDEG